MRKKILLLLLPLVVMYIVCKIYPEVETWDIILKCILCIILYVQYIKYFKSYIFYIEYVAAIFFFITLYLFDQHNIISDEAELLIEIIVIPIEHYWKVLFR